jgi:trk system potassium uptake protein TrkA
MRIVIVGCGRAGAELAYRMSQAGHEVTVVDQSFASFRNLHPDFQGKTLQGDVLSREVLEQADVERADGFAAVTNSDAVNAVAAHVARTVFSVPNVVVRNYAPGWLPLHEAFGYPLVSSTTWGARRVESLLERGAARPVYSAGAGEVELYELPLPEAWAGRKLVDLLPPSGCQVVTLTREGRACLPAEVPALVRGDLLLVAATREGLEQLRRRLAAPPPAGGEADRCS